jgi:L-gulonate 3-dehydrogenase
MKVAVIGAGLIGKSWAIVFARAGIKVQLWDGLPEVRASAIEGIRKTMQDLANIGLLDKPDEAIKHIQVFEDLNQAIKDVSYVQENLPEQLPIKRDIFAKLDAGLPPEAVIATSTSSIKISLIAHDLPGKHRCVVSHPVNPPHLIPVVEICGADFTTQKTIDLAFQLMKQVNQYPILLKKEVDGFILNRLQGALLREAFSLYEEGYASSADIDATVSQGLGLRWSFMGPFETIDLNAPAGLADYCARYGDMYAEMFGKERWSEKLINELHAERRQQLDIKDIPKRSDWRNQRLMALMKHKQDMAKKD